MREPGIERREVVRQLVHFGVGLAALLLPYLEKSHAVLFTAAAIAMNTAILPRLPVTRGLFRRDEKTIGGIVLYPTMVLLLVGCLPGYPTLAAGAWGVLAAGDAASALFGQAFGRRTLPWNPAKSWVGSFAFVLAALPWSAFLLHHCGLDWNSAWTYASVATLTAATLESLPLPVDDNITVAAGAGGALALLGGGLL